MSERWYALQFDSGTFYDGSRYATAILNNAKKYRDKIEAETMATKITKEWSPAKIVQIELQVVSE